MSIQIVNKDIFQARADVLIHQTNCFCTMGSGIAKQIRAKWPEVYAADVESTVKGDEGKLGKILPVTLTTPSDTTYRYVINCYSQFRYGGDFRHTDYEAYYTCLEKVALWAGEKNLRVTAPYNMGCALAGGDWNICHQIFKTIFKNSPVVFAICKHPDTKISRTKAPNESAPCPE